MTIRTYSSPEAFKQALEQRLRTSAKTGAEFARKRQLLVFDRFLARVVAVLGDAATLKGGLVLELRLERARTTKDVDLRMVGSPDGVLAKLQETARHDRGDFMTFEVGSAITVWWCSITMTDLPESTSLSSNASSSSRSARCSPVVGSSST